MKMADIVVVGSSNTDMSIKLSRLPRRGETVLGGEFRTAGGGKGANQAVAAARAGGRVSLVARIGQDELGDQALASYVRDGVDVTHVTRDSEATSGAALIFVARDGENSIAVASGANARLTTNHVKRAANAIASAKVLLLQLETPLKTVEASARLASASGTTVILNPAPARALSNALLRNVSVLTPNESEAELLTGVRLTGIASATKAAKRLLSRGVPKVIVTLGAKGALIATEQETELVPAFKVRSIDTTAAGDIFNGVLAVALTEQMSLAQAVRMANAAAALSVTRLGAQSSAPTRAAINRFLLSQR